MNVSPVSYNSLVSMKSVQSNSGNKNIHSERVISPTTMGVVNGVCWFGIGYLFDKACKAMFKTNVSNKTSLILNGVIGLAMGTYAYVKSKQVQADALKSEKSA